MRSPQSTADNGEAHSREIVNDHDFNVDYSKPLVIQYHLIPALQNAWLKGYIDNEVMKFRKKRFENEFFPVSDYDQKYTDK